MVEVTIERTDGKVEYFDTFVSESYADYYIALARCIYDGNKYNAKEYNGAKWIKKHVVG